MAVAQAFNLVVEDSKFGITPRDELVDDVLATSLPALLPKSIRAPHLLVLCRCPRRLKVFEGEIVELDLLVILRKISSQQLWPPLI